MMKRVNARDLSPAQVRAAVARPEVDEVAVAPSVDAGIARIFGGPLTPLEVVNRILSEVAERGEAAVLEYAHRIDGAELTAATLFASEQEIAQALAATAESDLAAIRTAAVQIRAFHEAQRRQSFIVNGAGHSLLGQRLLPLSSAGCYVPAGRAPLVSSALMSVIPAKVAGVQEVIAATPVGPSGCIDPRLLVALHEAGATRVLKVGGAQAVAALAYGTVSVPRVDKIVGPGNIFVQLAKKQVFGRVGIDSLAGPSEIVVIADENANPTFAAADLLSQAEHDTEAAAILITPSEAVLEAVLAEVERQVEGLARQETVRQSLSRWGRAVLCRDLTEALALANLIAPEHLELLVAEPWEWLPHVQHAGAVFLGAWSSEPMGDYVIGTNHILPTNGTARFASPLGVEDFLRRSSVISCSLEALSELGPVAVRMGEMEGLGAHAAAVRARLEWLKKRGSGDDR